MRVGVVLDTSALLVHLRLERVSVGELITVVAENGDVTGIPALAVLDALPLLDQADRERLVRLLAVGDGPVVVLPLLGGDLLEVDRLAGLVGGQGVAQSVLEAHKHGTSLATVRPKDVAEVMHPDDVEVLS